MHTFGGGVYHDAENHQHREQRIDHSKQLVLQIAEVELDSEHAAHRLHQKQSRRDQRQPEQLVLNTYLPVDIRHMIFSFLIHPRMASR